MKRRGQLLSIDALLSLVIVVMVVGVVMNTNDMIKAEITGLLDWYDRVNIANNVLDVLTKNPGYPEDWESNVSNVKMVGLRDNAYPFALDYDKIIALNRSKDNLTSVFNQLAREKDFLFEIYVSKFNVSIEGRFPRIYLADKTFKDLGPGTETVNFVISTDPNPGMDPDPFSVSYIKLWHNGRFYFNEEICSLISGNRIDLNQGDYMKFVIEEPIYLVARRAEREEYLIPANSIIELYIDEEVSKGFSMNFGKGNCSPEDIRFSLTGHGALIITVSAYDNVFPILSSTYTSSRDLWSRGFPTYYFSLINTTYYTDLSTINSSMISSPWVEVSERQSVVSRKIYDLSATPSAEDPLVYGFMAHRVLEGTSLVVKVPQAPGNLSLFAMLGTEVRGVFVYKNSTEFVVNGTLVWYENGEPKVKGYHGENNTIVFPFEELFGSEETEGKIIGLWLYSLNGWERSNVTIEVIPTIEYMLEPKFEPVLIRLLVWDDK